MSEHIHSDGGRWIDTAEGLSIPFSLLPFSWQSHNTSSAEGEKDGEGIGGLRLEEQI